MEQDETTAGRRLFVEGGDPGLLVDELEGPRGRFISTRLTVSLGESLTLAVRLPNVSRALELPVVVLGRRAPRGAQGTLSTGVVVRAAEIDHPMSLLLREVATGRVVDLEARIQEQLRIPTTSRFDSRGEAAAEIVALLGDSGHFPVDVHATRGDRLTVTIETPSDGVLLVIDVVVRSMHVMDDRRECSVALFDTGSRHRVDAFADIARASGPLIPRARLGGRTP